MLIVVISIVSACLNNNPANEPVALRREIQVQWMEEESQGGREEKNLRGIVNKT